MLSLREADDNCKLVRLIFPIIISLTSFVVHVPVGHYQSKSRLTGSATRIDENDCK
jgi:hypothetical protein